jgi:hypothetical protein
MAAAGTDNEQPGFVVPFNAKVTGGEVGAGRGGDRERHELLDAVDAQPRRGRAGSALPGHPLLQRPRTPPRGSARTARCRATASDLLLTAGDVVTVQMIHTGTGVIIPAGTVRISYQAR